MGKKQPVLVAVSQDFHYDLDKTRRRTLPAGWRGPVEPEVAKALEKAGKGKRITPQKASATKKAAVKKVVPTIDPQTDTSDENGDGLNTNLDGSGNASSETVDNSTASTA